MNDDRKNWKNYANHLGSWSSAKSSNFLDKRMVYLAKKSAEIRQELEDMEARSRADEENELRKVIYAMPQVLQGIYLEYANWVPAAAAGAPVDDNIEQDDGFDDNDGDGENESGQSGEGDGVVTPPSSDSGDQSKA